MISSRSVVRDGATAHLDVADSHRDSQVPVHDRRRLMQLSLLAAALPGLLVCDGVNAGSAVPSAGNRRGPEHDFDFFFGDWQVRHRRLGKRLAGSNEWEEFDGSTRCVPILGGLGNYNDSIARRSTGTSRGMGLRAFDAKSGNWADWYLDARKPATIEVHGIGRFTNGVGTFYSDDRYESRPVKVRGIFTPIAAGVARWEQAYSGDGGKTWETNYVMRYTKVGTGL